MKRVVSVSCLTFFLCLFALSMYGCNRVDHSHEIDVSWQDLAWDEYSWTTRTGEKMRYQIHPGAALEDDQLSERIGECLPDTPLSTDKMITEYAWSILPALQECEYLEMDAVPVMAMHFTNEVWMIGYGKEGTYDQSMRDGTTEVYLAEEDGHIIFIWYPGLYS